MIAYYYTVEPGSYCTIEEALLTLKQGEHGIGLGKKVRAYAGGV